MSNILARFIHVSDTHIEPEAGYRDRCAATIQQLQSATTIPEAILAEVIRQEQATLSGYYPYPSAVKAANALVEELNALEQPIDFVLHTGDITNHGTPEEYAEVARLFADLNYPIHYLAGNHDQVEHLYAGLVDKEGAEKIAYDYTFEHNGVHFVCVDSATHGQATECQLTAQQLAWLTNQVVATDPRPLIVAMHHPPFQSHCDWLDFFMIRNWQAIQTVLAKAGARLRGVLSGHVHLPLDCYRNGVLYSVAPPIFGRTPGYSLVTVTTTDIQVQRYTFPLP